MPSAQQTYGQAGGPGTKGGGFKGGPKRWTGRGPTPARHIPWPEIFKHHISVIEGHLKMLDMVRKHTVEKSANWQAICDCLDRCHRMLGEAKQTSRTFVPPPRQREQVPIGVSSDSMYPGYSPADHVYGEAAAEFGKYASEAKARGENLELPVDYELGQARGVKRSTLAATQAAIAERDAKKHGKSYQDKFASGANSTAIPNSAPSRMPRDSEPQTNGHEPDGEQKPLFVVDTQPMKLNLSADGLRPVPESEHHKEGTQDASSTKKAKKTKTSHSGTLPDGEQAFEDISHEVEARLQQKEKKKNTLSKKEKRKRESDVSELSGLPVITDETSSGGDKQAGEVVAVKESKPKKKKQKHKHKESPEELAKEVLPDRSKESNEGIKQEKSKKKKRDRDSDVGATNEAEPKVKREKKTKKVKVDNAEAH